MTEDGTEVFSVRIEENLNRMLDQIDKAKAYVSELRISSAIFRSAIDRLQEKLSHCAQPLYHTNDSSLSK